MAHDLSATLMESKEGRSVNRPIYGLDTAAKEELRTRRRTRSTLVFRGGKGAR